MTISAMREAKVKRLAPEPHEDSRVIRAARLLEVAGAGVLLAGDGTLNSVALTSDESVYRLCALEVAGLPGPAAASLKTGENAYCPGRGADGTHWPDFAKALKAAGYARSTAIPVSSDDHPLGVLLLCQQRAVDLSPQRSQLAQILATILVETAVRGQAMRRLQGVIDSIGLAMRRLDEQVQQDHDGAAWR